jgi:hypothetical protein
MPTLSYTVSATSCDTVDYTLELDFAQAGDTAGNGQSYGFYDSGTIPGNSVWFVNWSLNEGDAGEYGEGGNASLEVVEDGMDIGSLSFSVAGQTPTTANITALATQLNPPWWFGHALTLESSNQQFNPISSNKSGYYGAPIFGPPDGFGVAQIDGVGNPTLLTDDIIWTWTLNLAAGINLASDAEAGAASYWAIQYQQLTNYAAAHNQPKSAYYPDQFPDPTDHPLPPNMKSFTNYCGTFSPDGTARTAYSNGYGLVGYNAGNPATPVKGGLLGDNKGFASFETSSGGWNYFDWNYVYYVCNQPSLTLPN